ncbi:MAG: Cysteine desulfurase, partial [uncultured Gemmatimonadaceae bacterium]
ARLPRGDRERAQGGAAAPPAAPLDRPGARPPAPRAEHPRRPGAQLRHRQRRRHGDAAGGAGARAVRPLRHLDGGDRRRRGARRARDAAALHHDRGAGRARARAADARGL